MIRQRKREKERERVSERGLNNEKKKVIHDFDLLVKTQTTFYKKRVGLSFYIISK